MAIRDLSLLFPGPLLLTCVSRPLVGRFALLGVGRRGSRGAVKCSGKGSRLTGRFPLAGFLSPTFVVSLILTPVLLVGPAGAFEQPDRDLLEQLRALGYVGGGLDQPEVSKERLAGIFQPRIEPASSVVEILSPGRNVTDILSAFIESSSRTVMTIAGETRRAFILRPGGRLSWRFRPRQGDVLIWGIGREYEQVAPYQVFVQWDFIDESVGTALAQRITFPVAGTWVDQVFPLEDWEGKRVLLNVTVKTTDPQQPDARLALAPFLLANTAQEQNRPNVVLIIIDTLRADALSCYGFEHRTTPIIDSLAGLGVLFDNVIAQSPHTETSVPSILMGLYPHEHGRMFRESRHNSDHPAYVVSGDLPDDFLTMAEYFQKAGYYTAGVYNNVVLSERFEFDRGLYRYIDYAEAAGLTDPWGRIAVATAGLAVDQTIRALEGIPDGIPFHLFIHILDPHNPYTPPDNWNGRIRRSENTIDHDNYLCEVMFVDSQVGRLCRALRAAGRWDNTLLVITSDHGEEFSNPYGRPKGHGRTLFQTLLRVPLIFVWPESIQPGRRIFRMVETIDILPTVLELAGISLERKVSGESLVGLLRGDERSYGKNYAYAEGIRRGEERKAVIADGLKLVWFADSGREFLYNLNRDPGELSNIAPDRPEIVAKLRETLRERFWLPLPPEKADVVVLGQDGKDIVHTFLDATNYQPGIEDIHIRVRNVSADVDRVKIWADDHLQGNRAHRLAWRGPPQGEMPAAFQSHPGGLDIHFDPDPELAGRRVFVRVEQEGKSPLVGEFICPQLSLAPKPRLETNDRLLVRWSFDSREEVERWTAGGGGSVAWRSGNPDEPEGGAMHIQTAALSGRFRLLRPVHNLPGSGRVLIDFELEILSGGLRVEIVDPRRNVFLARRDFLPAPAAGDRIVFVPRGERRLVGLFFECHGEKELLVILSNRTAGRESTSILIDNFRLLESRSPE